MNGIDISLSYREGPTRAWYIDGVQRNPVQLGDWIGSVEAGGSVNFIDIALNPHAHGTHTETLGHICSGEHPVNRLQWPLLIPATLLSPEIIDNEVSWKAIEAAAHAAALDPQASWDRAIVLRTRPAGSDPETNRSEENWAYLTAEAAAELAARGVTELMIDQASVDPREDGGALAAHRAFWGLAPGVTEAPADARHEATITELIHVPQAVADGRYALNLQVANLSNDAAPSRPILYPRDGMVLASQGA